MASAGGRRFRDVTAREEGSGSDSESADKLRHKRPRPDHCRAGHGNEEDEPSDQVMEIPEGVDPEFLRKMLTAGTTDFVIQLHQHTKVRVSLGITREGGDGRKRQVIVLAGSQHSTWTDCKSRIEELYHMGPERQQTFLKKYGIQKSTGGPAPVDKRPKEPNVPETVPVTKSYEGLECKPVLVPDEVVRYLMTPAHREAILETTGAEPQWVPQESKVLLHGTIDQVNLGARALARVCTHCLWGASEDKIMRLLKPAYVESMLVRLSPMGIGLRAGDKMLGPAGHTMTVGKDPSNDVVVADPLVSRQHLCLELDFDRGAVYAINLSTNGTFLNGKRLPDKTQGKVLVTHGDELLLKDPRVDGEFGYMVNLVDNTVNLAEHSTTTGGATDADRLHGEMLRRKALIGCGN